jgi:predicted enzyme related to lactoylglutathione lyase
MSEALANPVSWFEIYVDDMPRAMSFYEAVFQVSLESITDPTDDSVQMYGFPSDMHGYGASGALVKMEGMAAGGNSTLVYFSCKDCAVEESRIVDAGGLVEKTKMSIGEYGFVSIVIDTEGNCFGLHSLV